MGFDIGSFLGSNLGQVFKDVVGTFKLSPEKKAEFEQTLSDNEHEIKLKEFELQQSIENQIAKEIDAKKEIMVAEMNQGDAYTKRARPTIVYAGLGFIFLDYVLFPILAFFSQGNVPNLSLPPDFWWVWGGVCGVWMIGRTISWVKKLQLKD